MKPLRLLLSGFWLTFAAAVILVAVLLSAARLLLPMAGEHREQVASWVSDALGQPVRIGALGASWHGLGPSLELRDVTVMDATGQRPVFQCASARIDINLPASLRHWQFEPGLLTVRGAHISLVRHQDGAISVEGMQEAQQGGVEAAEQNGFKYWLQRQERLAVEHSELLWRDLKGGGRSLKFTDVNVLLRNNDDRHRLDAAVTLPDALGKRLELAIDVRGDLFTTAFWQGRAYVRGADLRLDGWWDGQPPAGWAALDGVVDFRAWSRWSNGVQQVEGEVHAQNLHAVRASVAESADSSVTVSPGKIDFAALSGGFHWQRHRPGWSLDVDHFSITRQGGASSPIQWRVAEKEDPRSGGRDIEAAFSDIRIEEAASILGASELLPKGWQQRLAALNPRGSLRNGYVRFHRGSSQIDQWELRGAIADAAWQADGAVPGVKGLSGVLVADSQQGTLTLTNTTGSVDFAKWFRAPLPLEAARGRISWYRDEQALHVDAPQFTVNNTDINLQGALHLDLPFNGDSPYLDITASFDKGHGDQVSKYLPAKIMSSGTVAWLDKAIVNGHVSDGSARIVGRLSDFPFDNGKGQFDIRFKVGDGILDYAPGWPRLEEIDTEIHFHGRRFDAEAASAKSLSSEILQAHVAIPDMTAHPALLTVSGTAEGPSGDVIRYLTESPLRDTFGDYLKDVTAGGQGHLQLSLNLPLANLPAKVKGALKLENGSLFFRDADIDIAHILGKLSFTDRGLSAEGLRADVLGQPVSVDVSTRAGQAGNTTVFSAHGGADILALAKRYVTSLAPYVTGSAPWRGELRIPPKREGWVELQVQSSLKGMAVDLPLPMTKSPKESEDLLVQIPLPLKDKKPVHVRYGDIADGQFIFAVGEKGLAMQRGELRFGGGTALLPDRDGLRLAGTLAEFDASQWEDRFGKEMGGANSSIPAVTQVDMSFGVLKAAGQSFDKVHIVADRGNDAWDVMMDSKQMQGHIQMPDAVDAPLVMDMARLYLPRFKKGGDGETSPDPRTLHPLDIRAKSSHYGDLDLGQLRLHASRTANGLSFDEVHAHSPQRDAKVNGDWSMIDGAQHSSFTLAYDGADMGATLSALGFADVIRGGKTHADMKLQWPGSPKDFALAKAAGSVSFEIKDGSLLDVDPGGAGRIFGLLSFQALPRHLLLDFSDLFDKGFAFDSLAGSFTIEDGNAQTDNLNMSGPSARIEAKGRVGLAKEDYDQQVTVIPNVMGSLPVAGALAAGVGAGAALLLAEKILRPGIDKMTKVEYRVTGPWANPKVEKIGTKPEDKSQNKGPQGFGDK